MMRGRPAPRRSVRAPSLVVVAVDLLFVALSFLQQPGRTTYDTRLELTQIPGRFLASAFSLWQADANLGEPQNQAAGYLFPQGPFFLLAHVARLPPWVTQRLWTALVLIVAFEGTRRVARALDLRAGSAVVAGLAFALSPRIVGTVTVISAETLPGAVLPWTLLPLLLAARGRLDPRRAVLFSAVTVPFMGGVNAVETGAALVPAAVLGAWLLVRRIVGVRVAALWVGLVVLATLWWTLPLVVLSRYSPPFYSYVESAVTTTANLGWSQVVRGDTHWLSWLVLPGGTPWWPAAHLLATDPWLVVVSALVAAVGLAGLAVWRDPLRAPLGLSAAVGLVVLTLAHGGAAGTPLAATVRGLLDGALQIFRNVHKFDPDVRLPIALGVAVLSETALAALAKRLRHASPDQLQRLAVVPACLALALATPFLLNETRTPGWTSFPTAWTSAASWLDQHADGRGVLVVPGSGFAIESWGATMDEPALALDVPDWVAAVQAPLIPGASQRYLDALNALISSGRADDTLPRQLARAGIGYVVVRRDLDRELTQSPPPMASTTALVSSGLTQVAAYGPAEDGGPMVSIYQVGGAEPELRSTPLSQVSTVAGAPESILALQQAGLAPGDGATVLAGEEGWSQEPTVVTDGAQRRERSFGDLYQATSTVLQSNEPYRLQRAAHDYPGAPGAQQVTASYDGLSALRASSSRAYADSYGPLIPSDGPYAAVDDDPTTRWLSDPAADPRGQWLTLDFSAPRAVRRVTVQAVSGDPALVSVRQLEIDAGDQHRLVDVAPDGAPVIATFDGTAVPSVTVRVAQVDPETKQGSVGVVSIQVDHLHPRRTLDVPTPLGTGDDFAFSTDPGTRACTASTGTPDCDVIRITAPEEATGLDRTLTSSSTDRVRVTGEVVARTSSEAARLLDPLDAGQQVTASSVYGDDPRVAARFAYDRSRATAWEPSDEDPDPTLVFTWSRPRRITGLSLRGLDPRTTPRRVVLTADGRRRQVVLSGTAAVSIAPIVTRRLEVSLSRPPSGGRIAVASIHLRGARVGRPFDPTATTGAVCGYGPPVRVDGQRLATAVSGTLGDIVSGRPLQLRVCDPDRPRATPTLSLVPGRHRITSTPSAEFETTLLAGSADAEAGTAPSTADRQITVDTWGATRRTAQMGAGGATLVSVPQNFNAGWQATLDGRRLQAITVDGWQQGWVVLAGSGGTLVLAYAPEGRYRACVVGGLVAAGLVLLAAVVVALRRRPGRYVAVRPPVRLPGGRLRLAALPLALAAGVLLAGYAATGATALTAAALRARPSLRTWAVGAGGVLVTASAVSGLGSLGPSWLGDLCAAVGVGVLFAVAAADRPTP